MPRYKFSVDVCRIAYGNIDIEVEVEAKNSRQGHTKACRLAEELAGNYNFSEHTSEYKAQGATPLIDFKEGDANVEPSPTHPVHKSKNRG
jgi:hypothetical protein